MERDGLNDALWKALEIVERNPMPDYWDLRGDGMRDEWATIIDGVPQILAALRRGNFVDARSAMFMGGKAR